MKKEERKYQGKKCTMKHIWIRCNASVPLRSTQKAPSVFLISALVHDKSPWFTVIDLLSALGAALNEPQGAPRSVLMI